MGKRNRRKAKNMVSPPPAAKANFYVDVDSDDSDTSVTTTMSGFTSIGLELNHLDISSHTDELDDVFVDLTEKRTETRMKAFKSLNELLCKRCCGDWLNDRYDLLISALNSSLKRSCTNPDMAAECVLVCRTLGLTAVSLEGELVNNLFDAFYDHIRSGFTHNDNRNAVKHLCETLCALCICMGETKAMEDVMDDLQEQWMREDRPIHCRAYILHVWYVCIARSEMQENMLQTHSPTLLEMRELLESDFVPMRLYAAECITLFFCVFRRLNEDEPLDFDLEEESGLMLDELVELFTAFSGDRRSAPKKELTGQRKKFRILLDALENGNDPEMNFNIRREKCTIQGCSEVIQVECLRQLLRGGFQVHLIDNEIIQQRFGLTSIPALLERRKQATKDDRDLEKYSKTLAKRDWQKKRNQQRAAKQAAFTTLS